MRNTVTAIVLVALIIGFIFGFSTARLKYKNLLTANSNLIVAKDRQIASLEKESGEAVKKAKKLTPNTLYEMQNGKMVVINSGTQSAMIKDVLLKDGVKIQINGFIIEKDGSKIKLQEGQMFSAFQ